jgi:hypothetical protein
MAYFQRLAAALITKAHRLAVNARLLPNAASSVDLDSQANSIRTNSIYANPQEPDIPVSCGFACSVSLISVLLIETFQLCFNV